MRTKIPPSQSVLATKQNPNSTMLSITLPFLLLQVANALASPIPTFAMRELMDGDKVSKLASILGTTGLLSIQMDGHYTMTRQEALRGLCECESSLLKVRKTTSVFLDDGLTRRTTLATATVGTTPLPLDDKLEHVCGADTTAAMERLRDDVATATKAFIGALDHVLQLGGDGAPAPALLSDTHGKQYRSVSSIAQAANHLEHFHVYSKDKQGKEEASLDWHTDAGLFLAFTPAMSCHNDGSQDKSFWFQEDAPSTFDADSVIIMLGAGAQLWLNSPVTLQATRHAVRMEMYDHRAWYGMMHLVPDSAIIQRGPVPRTFADMKKNMVLSADDDHHAAEKQDRSASIGCGAEPVMEHDGVFAPPVTPRYRRRLQHVQDASACNNVTNFFCWMSCLDIPNHELAEGYVREGYSLYCLDPAVLASSGNQVSKAMEPCNGRVHNSNCLGSWQPTAPGVIPSAIVEFNSTILSEDQPFCYGGTSMYMDGFHWVHASTCIIYLVPQWILTTRGLLAAASIGTIFAGIVLERVIFQRRHTLAAMSPGYMRLGASALTYGLQLTLGYLVMLVVMTYSGVLFFSVVMGLMLGHMLFNAKDAFFGRKDDKSNKNAIVQSTNGHCCKEDYHDTSSDEGTNKHCCYSAGHMEVEENPNKGIPEGSTPCCQNEL